MATADAAESESGDARPYYVGYIFLCICALTAVGAGLAYLFLDYSGCDTGMAFTVVTLLMGILTTVVSTLNIVNKGLLTPCIMFAYSVFICWYYYAVCFIFVVFDPPT